MSIWFSVLSAKQLNNFVLIFSDQLYILFTIYFRKTELYEILQKLRTSWDIHLNPGPRIDNETKKNTITYKKLLKQLDIGVSEIHQ